MRHARTVSSYESTWVGIYRNRERVGAGAYDVFWPPARSYLEFCNQARENCALNQALMRPA